MNIEKILYWVILGILLCIFNEVILVGLAVIAFYLGIAIIKELKNLK